ncbi:serine/threonine-protein kinase PLK4 isoform X3 [Scaptodrosophila lebanonensis]|uniref:Serine/threonine-protein kinase PLK4 n=1 Tax=Drosophila lebanonensis TaxID=7225 RepID=A0A6J2TEM9_DROLE|nr:serine/threonine-protein kinase PLK4 isoform X3 [Scaptodrosophila lebanonensis]
MMPHQNYGETINEYEVQHLLGKGGFASVYKAKCRRTSQDVAIKMIDKKLIQRSGLSSRVRQEIEIHSRLKHPSVLQLYTFFQDVNYVYLVLELAHNGELQRYMNYQLSRPFTEREAAFILQQVVTGLLYLHSHHIMHRDISLSNLLICKDMRVKIADFGLATQLKRPDEKHMTMCGTPNYISPEVVSRSSHGLPADVWSVGCMLYTLLTGRPPFDTDAIHSTLTKVVMSDYKMPNHISPEACDLINSLLKKNPLERILLEQVLKHPFILKSGSTVDYKGTCVSDFYNQNMDIGDSGIVTFFSSDSKNSQQLRSLEKHMQQNISIPESGLIQSSKSLNRKYRINQLSPNIGAYQQTSDAWFDSKELPCQMTPDQSNLSKCVIPPTIERQSKSVPPLNTKRLQPTRYKTKNAIMSIQRNGEVIIEFIKFKKKMNEERIVDICRISEDGRRIIIYQPDPGSNNWTTTRCTNATCTEFGWIADYAGHNQLHINTQNTNSSALKETENSCREQLLASQQNVPIKRLNLAGIGIATELSHGVVQVQFYDGSVISVIPTSQGGGITYTQPNGVSTHFSDNEDLPMIVTDRLTKLAQAQLKLKSALPICARKDDFHVMAPNYNRILI